MTIERGLRFVAGIVILTSILLAIVHTPWWIGLTAFVGLNLLQSSFTNWCPMVWVLGRLGLQPCTARQNRTGLSPP